MTNNINLPIFNKICDLYRKIHKSRDSLPKQDRYTIWQRIENITLDIVEAVYSAIIFKETERLKRLVDTSNKINTLKVLIRLSKEVKTINLKKYISLQKDLDEIGRMVGGWIKSTKTSLKE